MRWGLIARIVFFGCAVLTGLGALAGVAVSAAYHPEGAAQGWMYLGGFLLVLVGLGVLVIWKARSGGPGLVRRAVLALGGIGFGVFGAYRTLVDAGDLLLWIWPLLMGVSLLFIAAEPEGAKN